MLTEQEFTLVRADLRKRRASETAPALMRWMAAVSGGGTYFASRPLFLDASGSYQPEIKFAQLKGRAFVGVIHKAGEVDDTAGPDSWLDPKFQAACQGAFEAEMAYCGYIFSHCGAWWLNNQYTMQGVDDIDTGTNQERIKKMLQQDPEFRLIVRQWAIGDRWVTDPETLKTASFRRVMGWEIDAERWWRSYNQYLASLRGQIPSTSVTKIEPTWIAFSVRKLYERLDWAMMRGYLPRVPVTIYSGKWFINAYSPDLGVYLETKDTHPAIYYWGGGGVLTTLEEIVSNHLAQIPDNWKDSSSYRNAMFGNPRLVQISGDRFKIPEITNSAGSPVAIDLNCYVHSQDWRSWLNALETPGGDDGGGGGTTGDATIAELQASMKNLEARVDAIESKLKRVKEEL